MHTIALHYALQTDLTIDGQAFDLKALLLLLNALDTENKLSLAATHCQYSYRKAWNLLQQFEDIFNQPLVNKQQGKGTRLSPLGRALINIEKTNNETAIDYLKTAEIIANKTLQPLLSASETLKIIASDSEKLNALREHASAIELETEGSRQALASYAEDKCELAGFHVALADNNVKLIADYCHYLDPQKDQFVLLERRQQGLISHPENPVHSVQQILRQKLRFVNRQVDSGTRLLFDTLLEAHNIAAEHINGYYHQEHTHLAVASMVSSRQADVGVGIKSAASRLQLNFSPVCDELYFLVFKTLTDKIKDLLEQLTEHQAIEILDYKTFIKRIS